MLIQSDKSGSAKKVGPEVQTSKAPAKNIDSKKAMVTLDTIDRSKNVEKNVEAQTLNVMVDKKMVIEESELLTNFQKYAIDLYKRGLNVFPIPYGCKGTFSWTPLKRLYNSRLHLESVS
jgi:hypothetical protein